MEKLRGIGAMARETGLTVSALRFYDRVGLVVPAVVDPDTGYRRYDGQQVAPARLVAGLRRVGMPLAEIALVLAALPDATSAHRLIDDHLRRLEDGLTHARRELSHIHRLLDREELTMSDPTTRVTVTATALAAALDAVRFAASSDPALPVLQGVLTSVTADGLEFVATDRFRLAVARATAAVDGPPARAVAPTTFIDGVRAMLTSFDGPVTLSVTEKSLVAEVGGHQVSGVAVPGEYPDHERLLDDPAERVRVTVDGAALRAALAPGVAPWTSQEHEGVSRPVVVLAVHPERGVTVVDPARWTADDPGFIAVNPEFLLQALDAGGDGQLLLDLDGPIRPLAIRGSDGRFSVLMPVRF